MRVDSYLDERIAVPRCHAADLTGRGFPPAVCIRVDNDIMTGTSPLVDAGSPVCLGQLIWECPAGEEHSVYSSVSGVVSSVRETGNITYIEIVNDGLHRTDPRCVPFDGKLKDALPEELCGVARKAGIAENRSRSGFVFEKLAEASGKTDSLVIDCIGENAYLPVPGAIARDRCASVINGIKVIMMATGARKTYVIAEDFGDGSLDHLMELADKAGFVRVFGIRSEKIEYPHCVTPEMIRELTSDSAGRYAVFGPEVCCDMFRAFAKGIPCVTRTIAVGGDCIRHPGVMTVPLGTRIRDVIRISGGLIRKPGRMIIGDPFTGKCVNDPDETVTGTTDSVYIISDKVSPGSSVQPCIRCGKCDQACRYGVIPAYIVRIAEKEKRLPRKIYGAGRCMECGFCSYVCPSGIDIVSMIKKAREVL